MDQQTVKSQLQRCASPRSDTKGNNKLAPLTLPTLVVDYY